MTSLEFLKLNFMVKLKDTPESLGYIPNIKKLDIASNNFKTFPDSFKNLANTLDEIIISNNYYSKEEISKLTNWLPGVKIVNNGQRD